MAKDTISYEDAFGPSLAPTAPQTSSLSYEEAFGLPAAAPKRRTLAAIANDTVIEVANAAAGGVSSAANFIRPGNSVSGWIDKNIVQAGEASQSDAVKAEKKRFQQDVANADGVMGELGAVGRYVVDNPGLAAAQAVGSFVGPSVAVKGGRTLASIAGLNAARGGLAGGAAAGAAMAGGDAAGTAYELSTKGGATDEQAVAAGRQASVIPAVIGGVGGVVGAERLVAGAKGFSGNAVSRAVKTAAVEGAQEGIEEGVTQYEGQRAAMPYDKTIDPMKGVAAAAGMGAALGAATGGGVSLLTGGHQQQAPATAPVNADDPSVGAPAAPAQPAAPAIDPNAGPLSKAASLAGDLGLAPQPAAPTAQEQRATLEAAISRLPEAQQREARLNLADLDNQSLPAGVRAMRDARLQELVSSAPAAPVELGPQDMERGRVVQSFDARSGEAPATRLSLDAEQSQQPADGIDFTAPAAPSTTVNPDAARIAELALAADLQPGEPMALNRAHALRRAAAEAGIPVSVVPHPSGRGYDVAPTARLDPAAQNATPQQEAAALLPFDQSPSGRMLAGQDGGVRAETRPEAVARGNAATAERQQVDAERQRRTELGMSNITPVVPLADVGNPALPRVAFDNAPSGRTVAGADGVRQEVRAEMANRSNQPAPAPQTVATDSGAPFASRQAAQQELQRQQLASTHEVAPAGGDESLGFVLQEKGLNQVAAPTQKAQNAMNSVAERAPNWRTNAMQANQVARGLGIETKGKRLAQVVAEIDAQDAQQVATAQQQREDFRAAEAKRTAPGNRARAAAGDANPFKAFIAKHGIALDQRREFAPGTTEQRQAMVPGYGPIFRKTGKPLDKLAQAAVDEGFLTSPDEAALYDLVGRALRGERIVAQYTADAAETEMQSRIARQREMEEDAASAVADLSDPALFDLNDDDIVLTADSNTSTEDFLRALGATDEEIQDAIANEQAGASAGDQGRSRPQETDSGAAQSRAGQGTQEAQPGRVTTGDLLGDSPNQSQQAAADARARRQQQETAQRNGAPAPEEFALSMMDANTGREVAPGQGSIFGAQQQVAATTPSTTKNAPKLVAASADESSASSTSGTAQGGGLQQVSPPRPGPRQESNSNQAAEAVDTAPEAINSAADSPSSGPRPARAAAPRSTTRIEDFGETLHGARKMLYAEAYADGMAKAKELDTKAHPLSKTWPEPDYQKLLEGGAPLEAVSLVRALREAVPTKPQSSWKLKGWAAQVETLRGFSEDVLSGQQEPSAVRIKLNRDGMPRGVADKVALYEAMGHERSLKGIDVSVGRYSMYDRVEYNPPRTIWSVSREAKGAFGNWPRELAKGDTREEAIAAFKKRAAELLAEERAPTKGATFEIYGKRAGGAREFFIGKKIGRNVAELKTGFADIKAARQYLADNQTELEGLLDKYKAVPPVRNDQNAPRIGEDYRDGADVTPAQFQEAFGFRGVQFGNYVEGGRRQQDLNRAYDAMMDLAGVLNLPPKALSLGGRLGLAFGARGSGGTDAAAAHYERGNVVINLTKREGAGSLAHEWWHSLDNYFSRERGAGDTYMTLDSQSGSGVREEMRAAFREVNAAINRTRMQERSRKLDDRKTKDYWTTKPEMSARAFESYVIAKLQDQNAGNDYLANVLPASAFALEGGYPYPTAGELPVIRGAFDALFQTVETRHGEGGAVVLYNTSDSAPPGRGLSLEQAQQAVQQALAGMTNPPPVNVVSRSEELGVGTPDGVMGAAIPGEGRIVLVASAHGSADAVIETVFHESFHLGLRNVLPAADYVQTMLDLAKRDGRVQEYANRWKKEASDAPQQLQALRDLGHTGSELTARYEALAIEEGLAVVAEELRAQKQAGTRLGLRVRTLANWLASVADRMGMGGLAERIRKMTYNQAERFVLKAIDHAGATAPVDAGADITRFRTQDEKSLAGRVGDAIKSVTVSDLKAQAGFKATDYRGIGLQFLGRRQLVDVYGGMLPEMRRYSDLMARMDADKNEAGSGADQLAQDWAKLPDERALAELMHDATLAQIDPSKEFVEGDNKTDWTRLQARYNALTPGAKDVFARARDTYRQHMRDVRSAIKERIERTEISSERKASMLKRMDDEFFGHIKGVYFPLARFGQYLVVVKDAEGKVANVSRAETMAEADATRRQLVTAFPAGKGFTVGKVLKAKDFVAERDSVGRGFMEQLYGVLDKQGMDTKQRAELEDALGQLYLSSLPDLSWAKHGIHRKGTAGFSQDARRAFAQNVFHGASYLAKLRYGDRLQDELGEMQRRVDAGATDSGFDSVKAQQVVDEMVKRHDAAMNPKTNAVSTALTSLGFMFHLGLSPASAMVNLTQTALVAYPVMAAKWGFGKASTALLKASGEAARGKNDITGSLSPEEKAAFDEAVRSGVIDVTMAHDLAGIAQGEDQNVSWKLRPAMRAASWLFHHAEKFNRQITFVAAYRLAREAGAGDKAAYEQAVQATYDGHFDYSSNNRPRVMQGNVARVVLLFKQYGQNMVYTLVRNAQQSLKGASPEERAQARKALSGLLVMHSLAAGALGLPMVTTLLAAASMLGGDADEPWDAQVALQNMLADTFGQKPAEVLAHGLSRLTPWDISGRVGLDKLIFPDVQEGLEGQRLAESAMTAALGPVAGIGINVLKGMQEMGEGRYLRGLETMAPSVARGPLKAWRYGDEGVRDKTGIVVQDEVGAAELMGQAAGFSPSSVRNSFEGKGAIVQHDRALMARRSALVEQFAMAAMAGDEEGKAAAREDIAKFNEKNPNRRIQAMQLAQSVHQREKRIREAKEGVYLPSKRRDAMEAGRFAVPD